MLKTVVFLSVFVVVFASISQENYDDLSDGSWYEDELDALGIISKEEKKSDDLTALGDDQVADQNEEKIIEDLNPADEDFDESPVELNKDGDKNKDTAIIFDYSEKSDNENYINSKEVILDEENDNLSINDQQLLDNAEANIGINDNGNDKGALKTGEDDDEAAGNNKNFSDNEDLRVEEEISQFLKEDKKKSVQSKNEDFDTNDYQVEDNRSDAQDKSESKKSNENFGNDEITGDKAENNVDDHSIEKIFEETRNLLEAEDSQMSIENDVEASNDINLLDDDKTKPSDENSAKTQKKSNNESEIKYVGIKQDSQHLNNIQVSEEDQVAEALDSIQNDLDQLHDTFNKLNDNEESPSETDDKIEEENILDYEDKYGRPFREGNVLRVRDDYDEEEAHDSNEDKPYDNDQEDNNGVEYEDIEDKIEDNGAIDDTIKDKNDTMIKQSGANHPILYLNDAILHDNGAEENSTIDEVDINIDIKTNDIQPALEQTVNEISSEVSDLMKQFKEDHSEDLDTQAVNFDKNVAPIFITLKVGESVEIASPNYPGSYPTDNIIDWVIEGDGVGLEMNVTDLGINGVLGDYLLVKPGGVDESGTDGLVFSYQLKSVRKYRFLNVNRMFIRFEAKPGESLPANQGFNLTVQLLAPMPKILEPVPEPEPVLQPPEHVMEVYLAGLSPRHFHNISEEFRLVIADMATMYINQNDLDIGETTNISEVTQLTRVSTCNMNWQGFDRCTGVIFGVPLGNEKKELTSDQLQDMWWQYRELDPFDARLRRLGITDFAIPNDGTTLMIWLLVGFGVAFSVSMLAIALWRWSCYEDYTRMPSYNDTDSVMGNHKRDLDLYPTPHQTIPPLYDDNFIKYEDTARIDLGGFANRSFAPDGRLYEVDSDDDIIGVNKSRSGNIQPKDIYPI